MIKGNTAGNWDIEYQRPGIPSSLWKEPSATVVDFTDFLQRNGVSSGVALDIGCGKGRNSLYLARQGFIVYGLDFTPAAIDYLRQQALKEELAGKIHTVCQSVIDPWPFKAQSADIAIDTFCYKHQVKASDRAFYRAELLKALKPGGYYLLTLAAMDDGYYGPLLAQSPNREDRIITDPGNQIPSILFSREDIEAEFNSQFKLVSYQHRINQSEMYGVLYSRSMHRLVWQKP